MPAIEPKRVEGSFFFCYGSNSLKKHYHIIISIPKLNLGSEVYTQATGLKNSVDSEKQQNQKLPKQHKRCKYKVAGLR